METAFAFGGASIALLICLTRQSCRLADARLIWDNRILVVRPAVIALTDSGSMGAAEEIVVSAFGILLGSRVFKWGCAGVYGVRLSAAAVERTHLKLTFGDGEKPRGRNCCTAWPMRRRCWTYSRGCGAKPV
ncbi:MAG: hypothetical protein ACOX8W_01860 [bacterium]